MAKYQITISIKSYDIKVLKQSVIEIKKICSILQINKTATIFYPVSTKKITLLRSPHIDKKSREQFALIKHKNQINISSTNKTVALLVIFFLKNAEFPSVEMKININYSTFFYL